MADVATPAAKSRVCLLTLPLAAVCCSLDPFSNFLKMYLCVPSAFVSAKQPAATAVHPEQDAPQSARTSVSAASHALSFDRDASSPTQRMRSLHVAFSPRCSQTCWHASSGEIVVVVVSVVVVSVAVLVCVVVVTVVEVTVVEVAVVVVTVVVVTVEDVVVAVVELVVVVVVSGQPFCWKTQHQACHSGVQICSSSVSQL